MDISNIPVQDRAKYLEALQTMRVTADESDADYSHRDVLEQKLAAGTGTLDDTERNILAQGAMALNDEAEKTRLVMIWPV